MIIHECADADFIYAQMQEEVYYLRSLGSGDPRKSVADFATDYPTLASDLNLPFLFARHKYFSSVLRVGSAGVQLWTHYDVKYQRRLCVSDY